MFVRGVAVALVVSSLSSAAAFAEAPGKEKTIARLSLPSAPAGDESDDDDDSETKANPNAKSLEVTVTRTRGADGGVTVRLRVSGLGARPQAFIVYGGGGDDDGAGDDDLRSIRAAKFELPGGQPGVRVDVTFRVPDGKKHDEQTDTSLIGFAGGKPHAVFELRTRIERDRSKTCREREEIVLEREGATLVTLTHLVLDPALGDDDEPLDKSCRSPSGATRKSFKWTGDRFVDGAPGTAAPAKQDEEDDEG